jgi:F-type H+-transporting ATPase subunit a
MFSRGKLVAVVCIVAFLVGFVFLRGPTPHITVKPETIFEAGPIDFTNTMITSWIIVGVMVIGVILLTRKWDMVPSGAQNVVEAGVEAFYNLVVNVAGEDRGRRFFPVVATIFFFVLFSNWLSLLPIFNVIGVVQEEEHGFVMERSGEVAYIGLSGPGGLSGDTIDEDDADAHEQYEEAIADGKTVGELFPLLRGPNTDVNTPLALAIVSAIAVEFWGISALGLGYGKKFFNFGTLFKGLFKFNFGMVFQGIIDAFVGILELISELVRLVSFTFRLFGNMFAGEVVILMFTFLTPIVVTVVFYGLEIFVGVIQAFIFAVLTLVFGIMAVEHGEHGHEDEHKPGKHEEGTAAHAAEA